MNQIHTCHRTNWRETITEIYKRILKAKRMPMNKYIFRFIFAIYMLLIFAIISHGNLVDKRFFFQIALLPLFPFVFFIIPLFVEFGTDNVIIKEFAYFFCFSALLMLALFFFLRKWLLVEFQDSEDIQYKKVKKLLLLASAFLIPLHFFTYTQSILADQSVIEYQKKLDLVPIDMRSIKIENYQETPFTMWGSQLPVGLKVEFDLVGGNQQNLLVSLRYIYFSKHIKSSYSESRGNICIPYDSTIEIHKRSLDARYQRERLANHFLLTNSQSNHVTFLCDNPFFLRAIYGSDGPYFVINKSEELIRDAKDVAEDKNLKDEKENVVAKIIVNDVDYNGISKDLSSVFLKSVPENSLLFNKNFWLNQTERDLEPYLLASGCSKEENYKFFCEKEQ